jgi:hypothetical protein
LHHQVEQLIEAGHLQLGSSSDQAEEVPSVRQ